VKYPVRASKVVTPFCFAINYKIKTKIRQSYTWISVSEMLEIPFVILKVIFGYKRKTQNKNNYSEANKTLLFASTRTGRLQRDCRLGREGEPVNWYWYLVKAL
jgi:hypothetical protein